MIQLFRSTMLALFFASVFVPAFAPAASAQIIISVGVPPPPLPDYDQPLIAGPGYIWTPGYWAYDEDYGYYWVPGTWVLPPEAGLLWTPGYWAFEDGNYIYYDGYWGPEVGFYGGVDYGYGYTGEGYEGGYWRGADFFYNRTVNNITNVNIINVYSKTVVVPATVNRVSYNGGTGGLLVRATPRQQAYAHQHHVGLTDAQRTHVGLASRELSLRETENKGRPPIAATPRPEAFEGAGIVAAKTAGERPKGQPIPHGKGPSPSTISHGAAPLPSVNTQSPANAGNPPMEKPKAEATPIAPENKTGKLPERKPGPGAKPQVKPEKREQPVELRPEPKPAMQPPPQAPHPHPAMQPRPAGPRPAAPHPRPTGKPEPRKPGP